MIALLRRCSKVIRHHHLYLLLVIIGIILLAVKLKKSKAPLNQLVSRYLDTCDKFWPEHDCSSLLNLNSSSSHSWPHLDNQTNIDFHRVLLVAFFNVPHYESAAKLDALYRRNFADIVYCIPDRNVGLTDFWPKWKTGRAANLSDLLRLPSNTKVISYKISNKDIGQTSYDCMVHAYEEFFREAQHDGIMQMSDDVIVNLWTMGSRMKSLNNNWIMYAGEIKTVLSVANGLVCAQQSKNDQQDCTGDDWMWVKEYHDELESFFEHLEDLAAAKGNNGGVFANRTQYFWSFFLKKLRHFTKGKRRVIGRSGSDLFYVAKQFLPIVVPVLKLFSWHLVFTEIAVPTALPVITPLGSLQYIDTEAYDWGQGSIRGHPITSVYSTTHEMLHPFKLSSVLLSEIGPGRSIAISDILSQQELEIIQMLSVNSEPGFNDTSQGPSCVYCNILRLSNAYADFLS